MNLILEIFNKHFSEAADNIHKIIKENYVRDITRHTDYETYMTKAFKRPFPAIKITKTTSKEIERIIGSLK
jgi:hypothetical protein